jgi:hypothetical protein
VPKPASSGIAKKRLSVHGTFEMPLGVILTPQSEKRKRTGNIKPVNDPVDDNKSVRL